MKKQYLLIALYMTIMSIGLIYCNTIKKVPYGGDGFITLFAPFLVILAVMVFAYHKKYEDEVTVKFAGKSDLKLFLIAFIPVVALATFAFVNNFVFSAKMLLPFAVTFLIGFAEEMMYRKILLSSLLKLKEPKTAILISTILFSILHAVNFLGGIDLKNVAVQLFITFLAGLWFASMYVYTKNIALLIIEHWLWDYISFSGILTKFTSLAFVIPTLMVIQTVIAIILIARYKNKSIIEN